MYGIIFMNPKYALGGCKIIFFYHPTFAEDRQDRTGECLQARPLMKSVCSVAALLPIVCVRVSVSRHHLIFWTDRNRAAARPFLVGVKWQE